MFPSKLYTITDVIETFDLRVSEASRLYNFVVSEISGISELMEAKNDILLEALKGYSQRELIVAVLMYRKYAMQHQREYQRMKEALWEEHKKEQPNPGIKPTAPKSGADKP